MNGLREICKCGHDRETHFEKSGACLGLGCNVEKMNCRAYRHESEPDAPKQTSNLPIVTSTRMTHRPHSDFSCDCRGCNRWDQGYRHL